MADQKVEAVWKYQNPDAPFLLVRERGRDHAPQATSGRGRPRSELESGHHQLGRLLGRLGAPGMGTTEEGCAVGT